MEKIILLLFALSITGAGSPLIAQENDIKESTASSVQADTVKKPSASKKKATAKKKRAVLHEAESEYKFKATDTQSSYTFDKEGNPIVKKKNATKTSHKGKRSTTQGAAKAIGRTTPKLKTTPVTGKNAVRYVCPMGDYEGDKPGKCPKCGMTLSEKK